MQLGLVIIFALLILLNIGLLSIPPILKKLLKISGRQTGKEMNGSVPNPIPIKVLEPIDAEYVDLVPSVTEIYGSLFFLEGCFWIAAENMNDPTNIMVVPTANCYYQHLGKFDHKWFNEGDKYHWR